MSSCPTQGDEVWVAPAASLLAMAAAMALSVWVTMGMFFPLSV